MDLSMNGEGTLVSVCGLGLQQCVSQMKLQLAVKISRGHQILAWNSANLCENGCNVSVVLQIGKKKKGVEWGLLRQVDPRLASFAVRRHANSRLEQYSRCRAAAHGDPNFLMSQNNIKPGRTTVESLAYHRQHSLLIGASTSGTPWLRLSISREGLLTGRRLECVSGASDDESGWLRGAKEALQTLRPI
ncbi:hypothetical protein BGW80DRAFT_829208 [Lactifluus volemus]|nr:hypothetical protein BGW80DRAFT_829208 [Lactifluus volemus]